MFNLVHLRRQFSRHDPWCITRNAASMPTPNARTSNHQTIRYSDSRLLVILLLVLFQSGLGDTVQITLARLSDAATSLVLVLLQNTNLLQRLHDLPVDGTGGVNVVRRLGTAVSGAAVDLAQTANTDGLAEVDVTGNGGGAGVVPVWALGWELVRRRGLNGVDPA